MITGRVTDAALTVGPAAWRHGWRRDDWDALAGAVVAGHVIECGAQATGGNFAFFTEVPGLEHPGFPIAEVAADGSSVITKHPGHGGMVSVDTVTAQLLYEVGGPAYLNPDVTARLDSVRLSADGPDRVRISGVRGDSPPGTAKVALNYAGGWRSTITVYLTGLDIEAKAGLVERALWAAIPGGRDAFGSVDVALLRTDKPDPATNAEAMAQLRITVKDADEQEVGRAFTARVTELALASYPGMFGGGLTAGPQAFGVYWPTVVPASLVRQEVFGGGPAGRRPSSRCCRRAAAGGGRGGSSGGRGRRGRRSAGGGRRDGRRAAGAAAGGAGAVAGAAGGGPTSARRSAGWPGPAPGTRAATPISACGRAPTRRTRGWPASSPSRTLKSCCRRPRRCRSQRYELPNLRAVNFVIAGLLGEGAAASTRLDPQAKSLGEWLRARVVDIPQELLRQ